jgi:uncharacterized protein with FMN-binding domain
MSKHQPHRSNSKPAGKPAGSSSKQPIDPLLQQRLTQLGQRRPAGAPLPPPAPSAATAGRPAPVSSGARPAPGSQEAKLAAAAERAAAARAAKQGGAAVKTAPNPGRKAKPARASKVASVAISAATTLTLAGLFARQDNGTTDSVILTSGTDPLAATGNTASTVAAASTTTLAGATASSVAETTVTTATTVAAAPNTIADGTYAGVADQNRWGVVQVQAVFSGGQLSDVQILSYPDRDRRSIRINQYALPILIGDSVQSGSANINGVSGATYTSRSYVTSLQSAIDAAKQASGVTG